MTDPVDPDVPRRWRVLYACLRCAPWTEIKTATAVAMLPLTGLFLVIASARGYEINVTVLDSWLLFLTGAWGIASVAAGWKQSVAAKVAAIGGEKTP